MDNFDLKKFLIENRLNSKSNLNEGAPGKYSMDNINVDLMNPSGDFIHMDDLNRKIRIQFGMGDKRMVLPTPPSLTNLTPMYQNIPKLEREVWEAITNEFRKLDERLPLIVQNVINNYDPSLSEGNKSTYNSRLVESDEFDVEFDADSELEKLDSKIKKGEYIPTTKIIRIYNKITSADFDFNAIRKDSKYDPVVKKIEGAEVRNIDPIKKEIKLRLKDGTELIYPYAFLRNIIIPGHKFEKIDDK